MLSRALPLLIGVLFVGTACPAPESASPPQPGASSSGSASNPTPTANPATPLTVTATQAPQTCSDRRPCGPQEYCRKARCSSRMGKNQGVCAPKAGCTETGGPVCGCDHKTYPTACAAQTAGESVKYAQVCGPRSCGGRMGGACGPQQYCRFGSPTCDRADRSGQCIDHPKTCGPNDAPVVSCAGQRFANVCEALKAKVGRLAPAQ